jgi:hypothetical protein
MAPWYRTGPQKPKAQSPLTPIKWAELWARERSPLGSNVKRCEHGDSWHLHNWTSFLRIVTVSGPN